ncbi:MAG: glycosyltransferase family 39 protein [Dehalococcoidia bacterium]|nr:glycosyltransferase family 39 protein [Dehalococcoidia bacterium]
MNTTIPFLKNRYAFAVALITIIFFSVSVWNLGDKQFPASNWAPSASMEEVHLDLGTVVRVDKFFILVQDANKVDVDVYWGSPEEWAYQGSISEQGVHRKWRDLPLEQDTRHIRLVFRASTGTIGEVALFSAGEKLEISSATDADGEPLPALIDEQHLVENPASHKSRTYFDEIYFVRAADDFLRHDEQSERTHPPLSKLIIAGSISLFGDSPFGWRFAGIFFATALIPLIYLFARRMFNSQRAGLFAAALLALDFMHFTMGRMATGETFILFFVVAMFYFFYRYYQNPAGNAKYLFLSLVFFGLGFATKWVTMYGFVGIVLLLAVVKWRKPIYRTEILALGGGLLAAISIYMLTYVPQFMLGHGLRDFIDMQFFMFRFHGGLEAPHPHSSPWWSWPLMVTPLWLYVGYFHDSRAYISSMGNPALWWVSVPIMLLTGWKALRDGDMRATFIVIPFFAQWLIFAPITRALFIYHFFPNVLFMVLAATLWMEHFWLKAERRKSRAAGTATGKWFSSVAPWAANLMDRRRGLVLAYIGVNLAFFLALFPVISGLPAGNSYWDSLSWLVGWVT